MTSIHNDTVLGLSVAILAVLGCWLALGYSADARVFPLIVLVPSVILGLHIAVRGVLRQRRGEEAPAFFVSPARFALVVGSAALMIIGVQVLGFLTTVAVAIPLLSFLLGYRRPLPVLLTTVGFVLVIYIVFIEILSRPLPREIWTTLGG